MAVPRIAPAGTPGGGYGTVCRFPAEPKRPPMIKILLPVDGSELSLDAVNHALRLVRDGLQAGFVLANAQAPANLYELVTAPDAGSVAEISRQAGLHALQPAAALLDAAGVTYETAVSSGDASQVLLDIAERFDCDAIVIGARGAGGLRQALLGSVSNSVLHDARVPVTIVRHAPPQAALVPDVDDEAVAPS